MARKPPIGFCTICGDPLPTARHKKVCAKETCKKANQKKIGQGFDRKRREKNRNSDTATITCAICGDTLELLAPAHVQMHGITIAQYRQQYPDVSIMTKYIRQTRGKSSMARAYHLSYPGKEPDDQLYAFLVGSLLGDGSIEKRKMNARYAEGGNNKSYLQWKYQFLQQYFHCTWNERTSSPHAKTGKSYLGWWIRTATHSLLTEWHTQWYQPHKILPRDIIEKFLTPLALAVWFCDDGHSGYEKKKLQYTRASLYTMAFSFDENIWLSQILKSKFGITAKPMVESSTKYPFLTFTRIESQKIRLIIEPFHIPGMEYKYLQPEGKKV